MVHTPQNIEKLGSWFFVSLSSVTTIFCFVFLVGNRNSSQTKENVVVLLCSISSLTYTAFYASYDIQYNNNEILHLNESMCFIMPFLYKSTIAASRCFCNLIFLYRYKTVNNRISIFAVKKAYWFSVAIIVVTVLQTVFDCIFFWFVGTKESDCFNMTLKIGKQIYLLSIGLLYFLVAVFQAIILCEIIKPIFKHCTRLNSANNNVRCSFYRVVLSTLVFCLSDFGSIVVFLVRVSVYESRTPILFVINLNINTLSLMCSYDNYRTRLFPFLCCLECEESNRNRRQVAHKSVVSKRINVSSQNRSNLKTIDTKTEEVEGVQMQETIVIHPNIILEIPVSFRRIRK